MTFALLLHFLLPFFSNLIDSDFTFYFALASLSLFQIIFRRTETFVALGLLFVLARLIPVVGAVGCPRCGGAVGAACLGDPTKCPMFTDVRTNANILTGVALAAGVVGTTLTVTNLLPPHLRRIFGRTELDFIVSLQRRTEFASGTYSFKKPATADQLQADSQKTEYDKELSEIIADCKNGLVTQTVALYSSGILRHLLSWRWGSPFTSYTYISGFFRAGRPGVSRRPARWFLYFTQRKNKK